MLSSKEEKKLRETKAIRKMFDLQQTIGLQQLQRRSLTNIPPHKEKKSKEEKPKKMETYARTIIR